MTELNYEDAITKMTELSTTSGDVGVFWDRGWGDNGEIAEITIITDGNGQKPHAHISGETYRALRDSGAIAPNSLMTYKARKYHAFVTPNDEGKHRHD